MGNGPDLAMSDKVSHWSAYEYLKCIDYTYKNYYCDHEDKQDDMGSVGVDNPPKKSLEWCLKSK